MARASGFTLTHAMAEQKMRGQALLIVNAMSETEPRTIEQIAAAIEKELQTRQPPTRVVSFYMSTWKKKNLVATHNVETPDEQVEGTKEAVEEAAREEPVGDPNDEEVGGINQTDAASTGASLEERAEAASEVDLELATTEISQNVKVSEAVLTVMQSSGKLDVPGIVSTLSRFNYTAKPEQVRGALSNLVRRGVVIDAGAGHYEARG